eukprot:2841921-Prymnesium_polylepis.1
MASEAARVAAEAAAEANASKMRAPPRAVWGRTGAEAVMVEEMQKGTRGGWRQGRRKSTCNGGCHQGVGGGGPPA